MKVIWDDEKNEKLIQERGISFQDIAYIIEEERYTAIIENPSRENQQIFIFDYNEYTYAVPFVIDDKGDAILKTIFPSRKYKRHYKKESEKDEES
ncbi:MAG: BrnT family toxin [Planctomycetaceae bacterium]|jgi:uncharacterized DUF497 family protein|nr:BrnT family toxin [Planctomycetaceae bacterium]